jgi:hypothetical protein
MLTELRSVFDVQGTRAADVLLPIYGPGRLEMIICERCGWLIADDCTCRRRADSLSVVRAKGVVDNRHRESVARAYAAGWPARSYLQLGPERRVAG